MADLKTWGAVLDHPVDGSSLPCLSLCVSHEERRHKRRDGLDWYVWLHVLLLPDGFILVKTVDTKYREEGDPYNTIWTHYQVASGQFRQSEGLASIEIIWTGCWSRRTMSAVDPSVQDEDSGWRSEEQRVPKKTLLPLGDSYGRLNVAELCEAWRKADRRWISKCYN